VLGEFVEEVVDFGVFAESFKHRIIMVNLSDRQGAYKWGVGKTDAARMPKYGRIGVSWLPAFLLFGFLGPKFSFALKTGIEQLPYWENRRKQAKLKKANFDLLIDTNSTQGSIIKNNSVF